MVFVFTLVSEYIWAWDSFQNYISFSSHDQCYLPLCHRIPDMEWEIILSLIASSISHFAGNASQQIISTPHHTTTTSSNENFQLWIKKATHSLNVHTLLETNAATVKFWKKFHELASGFWIYRTSPIYHWHNDARTRTRTRMVANQAWSPIIQLQNNTPI